MSMVSSQPPRVYFFPFLAPGHMLPILDIATLVSRRGVSATIITTPGNETYVRPAIDRSASSPNPISLLLISFPDPSLLPAGCQENFSSLSPSNPDTQAQLYYATSSLHQPLLALLRQSPAPDCLISDSVYHWTADIATELNFPRIVFHGPGIFFLCVQHNYEQQYRDSDTSATAISIEGLPHDVKIAKSELPEVFHIPALLRILRASEEKSYGVIVNSFYELEPEYADLYRSQESGRRAWYIGPVSLCEDSCRLDRAADADEKWRSWLDSKPAGSVLYICFGSISDVSDGQLDEIAAGLSECGHAFIWVVRRSSDRWSPPEFEKGVVISGWAPQTEILGHPAVGGFLTHCGWNSTLEGVAAGLPMIGWPLFYDQFFNAKLVSEILRIGVRVERKGGNVIVFHEEACKEVVGRGEIVKCVESIMGGGEEAAEMRRRAKGYGEKAKAAMGEGGSSYEDLGRLIQELSAVKSEVGKIS